MDTRLITVFIALVFLVLTWNAALLWFIRRGLQQAADRAARQEEQLQSFFGDLKAGISHLESVSATATQWSGQARERVQDLEGDFDRADNWVRYGLAKLDFNVDKVSERLDDRTREIKSAISGPLFQTATVVQGVKALLELLTIRNKSRKNSPPAA